MANRKMEVAYSLDRMVCSVFGKANITNTTGVVASFSGLGITTIARTGAGEYTITLDDKWNDFLGASISVVSATPVDLVAQIDNYTLSSKTIVFNGH